MRIFKAQRKQYERRTPVSASVTPSVKDNVMLKFGLINSLQIRKAEFGSSTARVCAPYYIFD
jgi:hypothetical protein